MYVLGAFMPTRPLYVHALNAIGHTARTDTLTHMKIEQK